MCHNTTTQFGEVYDECTSANVARLFICWFICSFILVYLPPFFMCHDFPMVWFPILEWTFKEEFKNEQKWNDLWLLYKYRTYDCFSTNEACSAYTMFIRGGDGGMIIYTQRGGRAEEEVGDVQWRAVARKRLRIENVSEEKIFLKNENKSVIFAWNPVFLSSRNNNLSLCILSGCTSNNNNLLWKWNNLVPLFVTELCSSTVSFHYLHFAVVSSGIYYPFASIDSLLF